ncbi:MAG: hypothetical protein IRZ33_03175 [Alicyclobacillaceae bacterium]|nr:hypothetical protein [Alicyclobacillaceae bacterium]
MTSRRKSIGRGDEASGAVMSALASRAMARGETIEKTLHPRHGIPREGWYSTRLGGEYGASVSHLQ